MADTNLEFSYIWTTPLTRVYEMAYSFISVIMECDLDFDSDHYTLK